MTQAHPTPTPNPAYVGRFAPTPSGPLHFGSLLAAVGSYLEARSRGGAWRVRMEDIDRPRVQPGAAEGIVRILDALGMAWDGEILYQSQRDEAYREALRELERLGAVYPCACTRKEIADSSLGGPAGPVYSGACRQGLSSRRAPCAARVRTVADVLVFDDSLQGRIAQSVEREVGDFVVRRADGQFSYQLAVVVDDAEQGISDVVRGIDLIDSTPRQIYLQSLLGLPTPSYLHLPVAVNGRGEKLSKQTRAPAVSCQDPVATLCRTMRFLRQEPPPGLEGESLDAFWQWAIAHWQPQRLQGVRSIVLTDAEALA
ncbi:MAG: tRNA glutamyl-Q(34) synthetase GluQRS [Sulfuricellaceae bacterium]|nr:tRNA glutamyl-Q(34) synthetase GluQRS [Sulfuricellaceae bacterium]